MCKEIYFVDFGIYEFFDIRLYLGSCKSKKSETTWFCIFS